MFSALKKMAAGIEDELNNSVGSRASHTSLDSSDHQQSDEDPVQKNDLSRSEVVASSTPKQKQGNSKESRPTGSKLDRMDRSELVAHSQKQTLLLKRLKAKCDEQAQKLLTLAKQDKALASKRANEAAVENDAASEKEKIALDQTNSKLKKLAMKLKQTCTTLQGENKELKSKVDALLKEQNEGWNRQADGTEADETVVNSNSAANAKIVQLQQELDEAKAGLTDSKTAANSLEETVSSLEEKLANHNETVEALNSEQVRREEMLQEESTRAKQDLLQERQMLAEMKEQTSALQLRYDQLKSERSAESNESAEGENASQDADTNELKDEVDRLTEELKSVSSKRADALEKMQDEVSRLESANTMLASQVTGLESEKQSLDETFSEISEQVKVKDNAINELTRDLNSAKEAQIEAAKEEATTSKATEQDGKMEPGGHESGSEGNDDEDAAKDDIDGDRKNQDGLVADSVNLGEQLSLREQDVADLKEEYGSLKEQYDSALEALKVAQENLKASQKSEVSLTENISELESKCKEVSNELSTTSETLKENVDRAAKAHSSHKQELKDNRETIQEQKEDLELAKESLRALRDKWSALDTRFQQAEVAKSKLQLQLKKEKNEHSNTKQRLTEASAGASQSSMLDLELADYQRTVDSLNSRVKELEEELKRQKTQAEGLQATITGLKEEVARVEAGKTKMTEQASKLKALLIKMKGELKQKNAELDDRSQGAIGLQAQTEEKSRAVEDLTVQVTQLTVDLSSREAEHREVAMAKDIEIRNMRFELEEAQKKMLEAIAESQSTGAEFRNYKIRAHSVLKAEKEKAGAEEASKQLEELQAKADGWEKEKTAIESELKSTTNAYAELEREYDAICTQVEGLQTANEAAAAASERKLSKVLTSSEALEQQQTAALAQLRADNSALALSHKQRMQDATQTYETRVRDLEHEVGQLRNKVTRKPDQRESMHEGGEAESSSDTARRWSQNEQETVAADGVPSTKTATPSASTNERLSHHPQDLGSLVASGSNMLSPSDVSALKLDLESANKNAEHLSSLVEEGEGHLQRVTEQVKVLKEEIRRLERNDKRDSSTNLEYLKNVILKHFESSEEEQEQLIPVLGMLLQFSPEELGRARRALQGSKTAEASSSPVKQWSSYLSSWAP